jgi:DNA repair protein RadC
MSGLSATAWQCPRCGFDSVNDNPPDFYRPWHLRGPNAVKAYVASLGEEAHEWLLALYVDKNMDLLAVDTVAKGDISSCPVPSAHILCRGYSLKAAGFILVHNHPSGDATPSFADVQATRRLARSAEELGVVMISHLVIAGDEMRTVGYW